MPERQKWSLQSYNPSLTVILKRLNVGSDMCMHCTSQSSHFMQVDDSPCILGQVRVCPCQSRASLGCQKLWGKQLLSARVQPDFGAGGAAARGAAEEALHPLEPGQSLQLLPRPISAPLSSHCPTFLALFLSEVVLHPGTCERFWSSRVKQSWSVSFAKAGALLPWPLKDKSVIQTNPCCFSKQWLCVQHSWGLGVGLLAEQGRAACCFLWEERWKYIFQNS